MTTDDRLELAIMFAERLIVLQDFSILKAAKVAAATHEVDFDALLTEWTRRLMLVKLTAAQAIAKARS